jgi:glucokinase
MGLGLVVVSGLPASGKTTLSRSLATELGFVHVWRDGLKVPLRPMTDAVPAESFDVVGLAMNELVNSIVSAVLDAGTGAVVDSNFNREDQADALRRLVAERRPRCFEICLWGDADVLTQRFIDRADPPLTQDLRPYFETVLHRERRPVLDTAVLVEVDTTDFSRLAATQRTLIDQVRAFFAVR